MVLDNQDSVFSEDAHAQLPNVSGIFCVTSNCGNANLLGAKPVRREVDLIQGSKGVCCNNGGLYSNSEDWLLKNREIRTGIRDLFSLLWPVSSLPSPQTESVLWMVQPPVCWILRERPQSGDHERAERTPIPNPGCSHYCSCHCVNLWLREIWLLNY